AFRGVLHVKPFYQFTGVVPEGMTIDAYTGQIQWTPSLLDAGSTVTVSVQVLNSAIRSPLQTQTNVFQIHVNVDSPYTAYIRDVFGVLLSRLPTAAELRYWSARLSSGWSRFSFVNGMAHSDERFTNLANTTFLSV